ncbi:sugar phosphate isomerase/epimerase family protein [Sphingobacterium prati]|uniref:sugar phosphate isomerase/epimerase family protein n=1 Tax=Sphingobacterium prati TaxID=2737006 RepID=UPI001553B715|nr:sugar phosphate isomerase/epimerase family protein [Sphingobacterium prati]NPE49062.1 sugar phosphate isomerase/epimerase [Sphingobacterium prati]
MMNRKKFIRDTLFLIGVAALPSAVFAAPKRRYNVAVIDLMILKRQKLSAFDLAKEIGADGLEVDMGGLGNRVTFESKLGDPVQRKAFLDKAKETGITICSLAMTGFYAQSFATRPTYQQMVGDCLEACQNMGVKVAFLPLGVTCDLVKYPELRPAIVERLRIVAEMAKKAGVIIGIETALDAKAEVDLLKEIGSKHIQIYFNFSNPLKEGRDLIQELTILGKKRICQIHCTDEDGVWLENNKRLNMPLVKQALDRMGWRGWLVIERSRDAKLSPRAVKENFGANTRYVKQLFQ